MQPTGQRITIQSAMTFRDPLPAAVDVAIVGGGVAATLAANLLFAWAPLAARPARVLRARE